MSEWTESKQSRAESFIAYTPAHTPDHVEFRQRAFDSLKLCAGHADLTKCEVVEAEELGHLRSLTHAMESQVANRLRADLCTEQRRYEDMHQVAYRAFQALKKLSFMAQTTGGVAGPDAGLQEAIQEAGYVMSMAGVSEAVDAASELIAERTELATLREQLATMTRERDLAVAHDLQPYPTAHAYEMVCNALNKCKEQLAAREAEIFHLGERNSHLHDELARVCAEIENRQPLFCAKTEIRQPDEARQEGGAS